MKLVIELSETEAEKLREEAVRLDVSPEALARAAISDLLSMPDPSIWDIAARAAAKYRNALRQLAE